MWMLILFLAEGRMCEGTRGGPCTPRKPRQTLQFFRTEDRLLSKAEALQLGMQIGNWEQTGSSMKLACC